VCVCVCVCVCRRSKLRLIKSLPLHMDLSTLFDRPNVAQILEFETLQGCDDTCLVSPASAAGGGIGGGKEGLAAECLEERGGKTVIVANTHILYNPKRGDIKLQQVAMTLSKLWDLRFFPPRRPGPHALSHSTRIFVGSMMHNCVWERVRVLCVVVVQPRRGESRHFLRRLQHGMAAWRCGCMQACRHVTCSHTMQACTRR
jgi:hypothetical protein